MSVRFPAEIYSRFRPEYPGELYGLLRMWGTEAGLKFPLTVADIGCGTGQSTVGLVRSGLAREIFALEPDAAMLAQAELRAPLAASSVKFMKQPGEATDLPNERVDVITCFSAFHWMNRERAAWEFTRVLRKPGLIFLAEYGFPIASTRAHFNDWIREKLRGEWQSPELRDRESFADLVKVIAARPGANDLGVRPVAMTLKLGWQQVAGLIQSQSRYTRHRDHLESEDERQWLDQQTTNKTKELLGENAETFDFRLLATGFAF